MNAPNKACAKCGSQQSGDGSCPSCMLTTAAWDEGECEADRIFQVALSYHLSERDDFVAGACAGKPELLEEVRMLLRGFAEEGGDGAVPTLPGEAVSARAAWAARLEETPGAKIGHFELVRLIGQGGMGSVWEARQVQPVVRRVALKVIKLGMDTREVVARFERERQALALMNHPNIAQVFEAGATELGRPYFVMELVRGRPITQYRKEEDLDIRPCLELFLKLCGAIEHAHQKGVIHRDLKPSNILVSEDGALKVIDFGVAKATRESGDMDQTRQAQVLGTPAYMSPEQALGNGVDVDTRTDVYALGVVLYELLCGALPFEPSRLALGMTEMQRILRDEEPQRPSAQRGRTGKPGMTEIWRKSVRGDLDWITLKCLEKDRRRRYASARALADDVSGFLESRPVTAAPPRRLYYAKKWVARHRVVFAAGVAVAMSLLLGSIVSLAQARRAGEEAERAKLARGEAERLLRISHQEEGKAWLERARALGKDRNFFAAKLMAGRALGFDGYGRAEADAAFQERYPVLLDAGSAEAAAARTILSGSGNYAMLWQSPSSAQHEGRVVGVAMTEDGALVASCASGENGIRVHGREDGKLKYLLESPAPRPLGVAFSADGKWLAAGGEGTQIPVWEVATGRLAYVLEGPARRRTKVRFSRDGRFLGSAGTSGGVALWDLSTRWPGHGMGDQGAVVDFSLSADGGRMAVLGADAVFRVFETETGHLLRTFEAKGEMKADAMALHPDGKQLYGGFVTGRTVVWDVETGQRGTVRFDDHRQPVSSLVVSRDGKWLASGSREGMVRLSETAGGKEVLMMTAHPDRILDMALSGDGRWLATGSEDQTVGVRDTRDGRRLHAVTGHSAAVHALAMSPDGRTFASAGADQTVQFWDPATGAVRVLITGEVAEIQSLDFSPSGKWLAGASHYGTVKFWNVEDGKRVGARGVMQKSGVSAVRFLSEELIVTAGYDGTVQRWETAKGKEAGSHTAHAGEVLCLDTAEGGRLIATGGADRAVILWRPDGKEAPRRLTGHTSAVTAVRFSPDGRTLASADRSGTLRFWDLESGLLKNSVISSAQALTSIDYRPDGARLVAAGQDGGVRLWNVETWKLEAVMEGHLRAVNAVRFCQDGTAVVTAGDDRTVAVWNAEGKELQARQAHRGALQSLLWEEGSLISGGADGRVRRWSEPYLKEEEGWEHPEGTAPVLAADERFLVSAGKGGRLVVRDRRSGGISTTVQAHRDRVLAAVFKPGGGELATLSLDGTMRIWEPGSWRLKRSVTLVDETAEEPPPTGGCLCYSRDGLRLFAAGGRDGSVRCWLTSDYRETEPMPGHSRAVHAMERHPLLELLAAGSADGSISLWNTRTGEPAGVLTQHTGEVFDVRFSPDGKWMASAGEDQNIVLWNTADWQVAEVLEGHTGSVRVLRFSADGKRLASGGEDGKLRLWTVARPPAEGWAETFRAYHNDGMRFTAQSRAVTDDLGSPLLPPLLPVPAQSWMGRRKADGKSAADRLFQEALQAGNHEAAAGFLTPAAGEPSSRAAARLAEFCGVLAGRMRPGSGALPLPRAMEVLSLAEQAAPEHEEVKGARALLTLERGDAVGGVAALDVLLKDKEPGRAVEWWDARFQALLDLKDFDRARGLWASLPGGGGNGVAGGETLSGFRGGVAPGTAGGGHGGGCHGDPGAEGIGVVGILPPGGVDGAPRPHDAGHAGGGNRGMAGTGHPAGPLGSGGGGVALFG